MSNTFIVGLGFGVVFVGLVCIVLLCKIVSAVCIIAEKGNGSPAEAPANAVSSAPVAAEKIENRQEIIAAVSACLAEELGTDVSAIRILSFKKI